MPIPEDFVVINASNILGGLSADKPIPQSITVTCTCCVSSYSCDWIACAESSSPLTIEQLARHVGLNRRKQKSGFKQTYGMTIFEYGHNHRMEAAWTLLSNNRMSIAQVAEAVGYEYTSNFCSSFKRRFGISPKMVRVGHQVLPMQQ